MSFTPRPLTYLWKGFQKIYDLVIHSDKRVARYYDGYVIAFFGDEFDQAEFLLWLDVNLCRNGGESVIESHDLSPSLPTAQYQRNYTHDSRGGYKDSLHNRTYRVGGCSMTIRCPLYSRKQTFWAGMKKVRL